MFNEKLKSLRIQNGLSQQSIGDQLGIPRRTIQAWELGTRQPPAWAEKLIIAEIQRRTTSNYERKGVKMEDFTTKFNAQKLNEYFEIIEQYAASGSDTEGFDSLADETQFTVAHYSSYEQEVECDEDGYNQTQQAEVVKRINEGAKEVFFMEKLEVAKTLTSSPAWDGLENPNDLVEEYTFEEIQDMFDMMGEAEENYFDSFDS